MFLLILLFGEIARPAENVAASQDVPTSQEIDSAVAALGAADFGTRQEASRFLWRAGRAAQPALNRALQSEDAEVADRVQRVLRRFRYGIYCDTPDDVVELIGQYRFGAETKKLAVLKALRDMAEMPTLLTLVRSETEDRTRKQLLAGLLKDLDAIVGRLFIEGQWATAEQLLQMGTLTDKGSRDDAAYLVLRGGIEQQIAEVRRRLAEGSPAVDVRESDSRQLAYCLRAQGNLQDALAAARETSDDALLGGLLFELGHWSELADRYEAVAADPNNRLIAGGIVHLGYLAAYHRLSGDTESCDRAVAMIKELAASKPNKLAYCAEALMVNDRLDDAVELFRKQDATSEFEVLCLQHRFGEALALAGINDPEQLPSPWFGQPDGDSGENKPGDGESGDGKSGDGESGDGESGENKSGGAPWPDAIASVSTRDRFELGLALAETWTRLGQRETAVALFSQLARAANDDASLPLHKVCQAEIEAGLRDEAFEHAALALSGQWSAPVLHAVFPDHGDLAEVWWMVFRGAEFRGAEFRGAERGAEFRGAERGDSPLTVLHRIRSLLAPPVQGTASDGAWKDAVLQAERESSLLTQAGRARCLLALGRTCRIHDHRTMARQYLEKATEAVPSTTAVIEIADLYAEDGLWKDAADRYGEAWHADRSKPLALYLQGHALTEAGEADEGRTLIDAARLIPLGDAETRCEFAEQLHARGFVEEAVAQWELTVRTGEPHVWPVHRAAECLGLQIVGKDDMKAAEYLQRPLLKCLQSSTAKWEIGDYLRRVHLIHKLRARGLLAAGRTEEALREIELARSTLPGRIDLATELVPMLEAAGLTVEADELFDSVYDVNRAVCTRFDAAADCHHDLASLAARCGRRLDEAMQHAEKAVALEPDNRAYLDTLADVRRQRPQA